jgi:phosphoribosyl 1,2-cyclic phosphodiesterase
VLFHCGCSFKKIKDSLAKIGEDIKDITAVFITHAHTDHTSALPVLLKNTSVKVCATAGTLCELFNKSGDFKDVMNSYSDRIFQIGENQSVKVVDVSVSPFPVPHDAPQTVGYNINAADKKISILTDIGYLRENLYNDVSGTDLLFLESNHDLIALENCQYTMSLKQRIMGNGGHLSNENAGLFATHLIKNGAKRIILGHLSGEANTPELAYDTVSEVLMKNGITPDKDVELSVSKRGELGEVVEI